MLLHVEPPAPLLVTAVALYATTILHLVAKDIERAEVATPVRRLAHAAARSASRHRGSSQFPLLNATRARQSLGAAPTTRAAPPS